MPTTLPRPASRVIALALLLSLLAGCAGASGDARFDVPAGSYSRAFDATRSVLRDYRFPIERVDARAGVITTRPKATAGLATPWDAEQSTPGQEIEDLLNDQRRRVRVVFQPADPGASTLSDDAPLIAHVEVGVYRVQNPGLRLPPGAISQGSLSVDPALRQRWVTYGMETPVARDSRLAGRIARDIERRLARAPSEPGPDRP